MTKIEWADETWNPITGCTPISEGCQNCYAKRMANRLRGRFGYPEDEPFRVTFHNGYTYWKPKKWKKSRRVFVCSMGDLFHRDIDVDGYVFSSIFNLMMRYVPQHTYLVLTKRADKMQWVVERLFNNKLTDNIWLGVTGENQKRFDERWSILGNDIPAKVKFVSIEPALEYVNIDIFAPWPDWVIWGPETGPGKRPYKDEWAEATYEQCQEKNIPFFDKRKDYLAREFPK